MRKLLTLFALFFTTPAYAEEWKDLEITYQALNAIDTIQTVSCLEANRCVEKNPIFGSHPKTSTLVIAKVAGGIGHYIITKELVKRFGPDSRETKMWLYASIGIQGSVVLWNFKVIL